MEINIQNQNISAKINTLGAELTELNKSETNYIWTINTQFWNKTSPVLFPIVGRLKDDNYKINNKEYSLPRHGFARNHEFKIIHKTEHSVLLSLSENKQTLEQYPFNFELQIGYVLDQNKLTISYTVFNNSSGEMPFSIGAHPAFSINENLENYTLQFENDTVLLNHELRNEQFTEKTTELFLQNKKLPLNYSLFEHDAIVLKTFNSKFITVLKNDFPYLKINLADFPHLGIWTKKNAPFLCLEPWHGYADNANSNGDIYTKKGIQLIHEKACFTTSFSIEIL